MKSFYKSSLHPVIKENLAKSGIENPTDIQKAVIPTLLDHKGDYVAVSETGTGKTYAFGIPLLSRINTEKGVLQSLVLVPTRELCNQVGQELMNLSEGIDGIKVESIYGGLSLKKQIVSISNGVQVIIATPGRLVDLITRKVVDLSKVNTVVFDEADEMLLRGFHTDVDKILTKVNPTCKKWLFSATMPIDLQKIKKKYLSNNLVEFSLSENVTNKQIEHYIVEVSPEEKLSVMLHFLTRFGNKKGIIFCRTKSGVQKLYKQLSALKMQSGAINGDLPQGLRDKVMAQFREGNINLLIATDVASRGVDIEDVEFIVQYHIPDTVESYIHRSGRTSRVGNTGKCLSFCFAEEREKFNELITEAKAKVEELPLPSHKDQLVNKAFIWARKVAKEKPVGSKLDEKTKNDFKSELNHLSKDELLEKILAAYLREQQN